MKNKFLYILIILIICIIGTLYLNVFKATQGYTFIQDDKLSSNEQTILKDFYNKNKNGISEGKYLDIKFVQYNQFRQVDSVLMFVFKGEYRNIDSLKISYKKKLNNVSEVSETVINGFNPFQNNLYNHHENEREIPRYTYLDLKDLEVRMGLYDLDNSEYDVSQLKLEFQFLKDDSTFVYNVVANKNDIYEALLQTSNYGKGEEQDLKYMNNFNSKSISKVKDFESYLFNLTTLYQYKPEEAYSIIKESLNTLNNSKKKKEILEMFDITQIFITTDFNELNNARIKELFYQFKILYQDTPNISDENKKYLFNFFEKLNNKYYQKNNKFFIPQNFKEKEIKEVIQLIK